MAGIDDTLTFYPLAVLVAVIPFLETIVGAGLFVLSFVVSLPLTLIVIAISWLTVRPLISEGLLAAAAALVAVIRMIRRNAGMRPVPQYR